MTPVICAKHDAIIQVLYSSEGIMELYRADKWPALQRVSHRSEPEDSWSLAAVPAACERLSMQIADLSRDPVVIPRSKVTSHGDCQQRHNPANPLLFYLVAAACPWAICCTFFSWVLGRSDINHGWYLLLSAHPAV